MRHALQTQGRVLVALTILSMQREAGESRLGYLSTLVQPFAVIVFFMGLHYFVHSLSPAGMSPLMFVVLGVVPFRSFIWTYQAVLRSPKVARNLTLLPRVTSFDVILSQCLNQFCEAAIVFAVPVGLVLLFTDCSMPYNIFGVLLCLFAAWLLGCGFGLVMLAVDTIIPVSNLSLYINRAGIVSSGLFFVMGQLPSSTWVYFTWNPLLHINEFIRSFWWPVYQSPVADASFVVECIVGLFFFGLMFQRTVWRLSR
jgi:capsular polysaccharide transport system permease protein